MLSTWQKVSRVGAANPTKHVFVTKHYFCIVEIYYYMYFIMQWWKKSFSFLLFCFYYISLYNIYNCVHVSVLLILAFASFLPPRPGKINRKLYFAERSAVAPGVMVVNAGFRFSLFHSRLFIKAMLDFVVLGSSRKREKLCMCIRGGFSHVSRLSDD